MNHLPLNSMKPRQFNRKNNTIDMKLSKKKKKKKNWIVRFYRGSVFVGHCTSNDLITHFFEFITNLKLNLNYLLNVGLDGPVVNKSFEVKLKQQLKKWKSSLFLFYGSCCLHTIVNNGFQKQSPGGVL